MNIHRSNERGKNKIDWLDTKFSFSFANYYNPERMGFGALRVLNDDIIAPRGGFGMHPHDNMEIITIVLKGKLAHKDSTGGEGVIGPGEVQVMSAGSGVVHSEYNASDEPTELLQIWIDTAEYDVEPRYDQRRVNIEEGKANLIVSNSKETLFIHQNAKLWLIKGEYKAENKIPEGFVHFLFVIEGTATVNAETLNNRDSAEITEDYEMTLTGYSLLIEVPKLKS